MVIKCYHCYVDVKSNKINVCQLIYLVHSMQTQTKVHIKYTQYQTARTVYRANTTYAQIQAPNH